MPQAVDSDSIPAPEDQVSFIHGLENFEDTIQQLDALNLMLGETLSTSSGISDDLVCGITGLFRQQIFDLYDFRERVKTAGRQARAADRLAGNEGHSAIFSKENLQLVKEMQALKSHSFHGMQTTVPRLVMDAVEQAALQWRMNKGDLIRLIVADWLTKAGLLSLDAVRAVAPRSEDAA